MNNSIFVHVEPAYPGSNSYNVVDLGRLNEFGEPYCHVAGVTWEQAINCAACINDGRPAWSWLENTPRTERGL